jgi:8-oxo-dGTP diphosphatase
MIDVVCAVIEENNRYLIAQRRDLQNYGKWEFPGGKVNSGETYFKSIIREINEELSMSIIPICQIANYCYGNIKLIFLLCHIDVGGKIPIPTEHIQFKWITIEEVDLFEFIEGDKWFVENIFKYLN